MFKKSYYSTLNFNRNNVINNLSSIIKKTCKKNSKRKTKYMCTQTLNMNYSWKKSSEIKYDEIIKTESFWNGICVWIERPHLLNRRLLAAELIETRVFVDKLLTNSLNKSILEFFINQDLSLDVLHKMLSEYPSKFVESYSIKLNESISSNDCSSLLIVRNLLSRNMKLYQNVTELCLLDKSNCSVTFYPMKSDILMFPLSPTFPYRIRLNDESMSLEVFQPDSKEILIENKSEKWLGSEILPKIYKWCNFHPDKPVIPSLRLISAANYNANLHQLKDKYGKYYIKIWPEFNNTDPYKYVYEDISICAYLITLWEEERKQTGNSRKQTFIDLACGNGLLVDILNSEGYNGNGIDLRKRKIWEAFKFKNKLIEKVIEPSNHQLFPEYDWIIGNHPDELTPWIPIIAARSSYKVNLFLMPCCFYTFNGKYSRCEAGLTRYQSYLKFIEELCVKTGFNVQQDKLRIPSTKRICFVCATRSYDENREEEMNLKRRKLINNEIGFQKFSSEDSRLKPQDSKSSNDFLKTISFNKWLSDFKPREKRESVQNCTELDKKIIDDIIFTVFQKLLSQDNYKQIECNEKIILWNAGGRLKFESLIKSLEPNALKCLKKQNGGFQTLLRNHKYIFEMKEGYVQIRIPRKCLCLVSSEIKICSCEKKIKSAYKTKDCYFHFNHPQGCTLSSADCTFLHDECS